MPIPNHDLILRHLPLAYAEAVREFRRIGRRVPHDQLRSEASLALVLAARTGAVDALHPSGFLGVRVRHHLRNFSARWLAPWRAAVPFSALERPDEGVTFDPPDRRTLPPARQAAVSEAMHKLRAALAPKELAALTMFHVEERSNAEAAAALACTDTYVRTLKRSGIARARAAVPGWVAGAPMSRGGIRVVHRGRKDPWEKSKARPTPPTPDELAVLRRRSRLEDLVEAGTPPPPAPASEPVPFAVRYMHLARKIAGCTHRAFGRRVPREDLESEALLLLHRMRERWHGRTVVQLARLLRARLRYCALRFLGQTSKYAAETIPFSVFADDAGERTFDPPDVKTPDAHRQAADREAVERLKSYLHPRDYRVLHEYLVLGRTRRRIAKDLGVSADRVKQLVKRALRRARAHFPDLIEGPPCRKEPEPADRERSIDLLCPLAGSAESVSPSRSDAS